MDSRGSTRPMMSSSHSDKKDMDMDMDRMAMLRQHHHNTLWIYWCIIMLGIWMLLSPLTFSYGKEIVAPSGNR
jgi:4-amino-4-deoxy-L-arabinose transferase-like glycosyltransferase